MIRGFFMLMKVPAQEEESWNRDFSCAEKEIGEGKNGKELTGDKEWYIIWT
jgi:hypothetical protein